MKAHMPGTRLDTIILHSTFAPKQYFACRIHGGKQTSNGFVTQHLILSAEQHFVWMHIWWNIATL